MLPRSISSRIAAILLGLAGLALFIPACLPYPALKSLLDGMSGDGTFNTLKPFNAIIFNLLFGAGGVFLLILALVTLLRRWGHLGAFFGTLWTDARSFFRSLSPQKEEAGFLVALFVITALAVVYRLEHIVSPMKHDEAYTYVAFGRSLFAALTDYQLPNNHVLHSILVYFSTGIFGLSPWAVRLPAFIAGVLVVPAVYWLGKHLYDRWTALAAALLAAWFPALISYANNARGYSLVALFTVLTLALGDVVRRKKNAFAWLLIGVFSALGFFSVPVMLFSFGVLFVWLFLESQCGDVQMNADGYRSKREFLHYWLATGFGTVILTLLFYLPILIFAGPQRLFSNIYVVPVPWRDLAETLQARFSETWAEWTFRVPVILIGLLVLGWVLGLIFHWKISKVKIPLQVAAVAWIAALLILQRPNAGSKVWVFLQPLMLMWTAAGSVGLLEKIRPRILGGLPVAGVAFGLVLGAGLLQAGRLVPQLPDLWAIQGQEEQAVLFIREQLQGDERIVVAPTLDAPIWYYSELHGIPDATFDTNSQDFQRLIVLVSLSRGQTLASVISKRGPTSRNVEMDTARLLETFGSVQVFEVPCK